MVALTYFDFLCHAVTVCEEGGELPNVALVSLWELISRKLSGNPSIASAACGVAWNHFN